MNYRIIESVDQIDISEAERLLKTTCRANHLSAETTAAGLSGTGRV